MSFISKWKEKRGSCRQFLKFLSRTIQLEDTANQPFPYKSFCSIHISGSPCGWYYLLTTIQTILRQYNYAVTLTLNFVVVFFTPTAPSQTPQEYPVSTFLAWPSPAVTSSFPTTDKIFLSQLYIFLWHHFTAPASLLPAHHKGVFISQAKLTITRWKSAETEAGMEKQKLERWSCPQPLIPLLIQHCLPVTFR